MAYQYIYYYNILQEAEITAAQATAEEAFTKLDAWASATSHIKDIFEGVRGASTSTDLDYYLYFKGTNTGLNIHLKWANASTSGTGISIVGIKSSTITTITSLANTTGQTTIAAQDLCLKIIESKYGVMAVPYLLTNAGNNAGKIIAVLNGNQFDCFSVTSMSAGTYAKASWWYSVGDSDIVNNNSTSGFWCPNYMQNQEDILLLPAAAPLQTTWNGGLFYNVTASISNACLYKLEDSSAYYVDLGTTSQEGCGVTLKLEPPIETQYANITPIHGT